MSSRVGRAGILLAIVCLPLAIAAPVLANAAPPPYLMEMRVDYAGAPEAIVSAELVHCRDNACADTIPLSDAEVYRPAEHITCSGDKCEAWVDPYKYPILQLTLRFADRELRSDPFAFERQMVIQVRASGLAVKVDQPELVAWFSGALVLTLAIELLVVALYLVARRRSFDRRRAARLLATVALGNLVTVPIVWFAIPATGISGLGAYIAQELFAWIAEAILIRVVNRGTMSMRQALVLSFLMNAASASLFLLLVGAAGGSCLSSWCQPLPLPW